MDKAWQTLILIIILISILYFFGFLIETNFLKELEGFQFKIDVNFISRFIKEIFHLP